jgi:hypothetical protein
MTTKKPYEVHLDDENENWLKKKRKKDKDKKDKKDKKKNRSKKALVVEIVHRFEEETH